MMENLVNAEVLFAIIIFGLFLGSTYAIYLRKRDDLRQPLVGILMLVVGLVCSVNLLTNISTAIVVPESFNAAIFIIDLILSLYFVGGGYFVLRKK